jgi:hypothetical protein
MKSINKKYIFAGIIVILIIIIFIPSGATQTPADASQADASQAPVTPKILEATFYPGCDFSTMMERPSDSGLIGPISGNSMNKITIRNVDGPVILENVIIKSYKSKGYDLYMYPEPDFIGEIYKDLNKQLDIPCLPKITRSILIIPSTTTPVSTETKPKKIEFYAGCDFTGNTLAFGVITVPLILKNSNYAITCKSYKNQGYNLFMYSDIDFKGTLYTNFNNLSEVTCLEQPIKSIIAVPI